MQRTTVTKYRLTVVFFQLILSEKKCWENHFSDIAADDKRDEEKKFDTTWDFFTLKTFFYF